MVQVGNVFAATGFLWHHQRYHPLWSGQVLQKSDVFTTGFLTILGGFGILLVLEPLLCHISYLGRQHHDDLCLCADVLHALPVLTVCAGKGYVKLYALDGILSTATTIFFNVLYLVVLKWGINGYILAMISADTLSTLFLFYLAGLHRYLHLRGLDLRTSKEMLRYSIPLIPNSIFWWINNMASRYLIAYFLGTTENGLFAVAYKIPTVIVLMSNIFMDAWQMSAVSDVPQKTGAVFHPRLCLLPGAAVYRRFRLDSVLESYHQGAGRRLLLHFLEIHPASADFDHFLLYVHLFGQRIYGGEKSILNFITTGAGAVLNVLLNLFFIPIFQVNGAAFATLTSYAVVFVLRALDTHRFIPMKFHPMRLTFNVAVLLLQAFLMIFEVKGWIAWEILLTALMLVINMGALWSTVRQVLFKRRSPAPSPQNTRN